VVEACDLVAEHGISVGACIVSSPLALDDDAMERAVSAPWVLVVEDHAVRSGLAVSAAEWAAHRGVVARIVPHGIGAYQSSGASSDLYARVGLDTSGIVAKVRALLG